MAQYQTNDRNGNAVNFDTNAVGSNVAGSMVLADPASGNKANIAPGGIALQVSSDGTLATYRAGGFALTFYSTAAAVLWEVRGSPAKTGRVQKNIAVGRAGPKVYRADAL